MNSPSKHSLGNALRWLPRRIRPAILAGLVALACLLTFLVGSALHRAWQDMEAAANVRQANAIANDIALAVKNLAFERGRANVVLNGAGAITADNREFIATRRAAGSAALDRALGHLAGLSRPQGGGSPLSLSRDAVKARYDDIRSLRAALDGMIDKPLGERDMTVVRRWFPAMSELLQSLADTMWSLDVETQDSGLSYQIAARLRHAALVFRLAAGEESAMLASGIATGKLFTLERIGRVRQAQGRTEVVKSELLRLAKAVSDPRVTLAVGRAMDIESGDFRRLRDQVYEDGTSTGRYRIDPVAYGKRSVAALDAITGIVEAAGLEAGDKAEVVYLSARNNFLLHVVLFVMALVAGAFIVRGTLQASVERVVMEDHLREAQKMDAIGKLTGGLAHDFNNLLGVVMGNLDLLRDVVEANPAAVRLVDAANRGAVRGAALTRSLLSFARRQPLDPRLTDINRQLDEVVELLRRTLGAGIEFCFVPQPDLWPVTIDAAQFGSCIVNLAANSRDAMPGGGTITITARNYSIDRNNPGDESPLSSADYVLIEFSDTGTGMSDETLASAFEPFFTTKGPGHGTGLGLSMVYGFVKQSGGHIALRSRLGQGTTVRIFLPCDRSVAALPAAAPVARKPAPRGKETILVVEDNAAMRDTVTRQLTALGYDVVAAGGGAAALAILEDPKQRIDLLFSDVVMPGNLDGYGLSRRAVALRPGLAVLLTSGFPGEAPDPGAGKGPRLLGKPYRHDDLALAVREALDGAPS